MNARLTRGVIGALAAMLAAATLSACNSSNTSSPISKPVSSAVEPVSSAVAPASTPTAPTVSSLSSTSVSVSAPPLSTPATSTSTSTPPPPPPPTPPTVTADPAFGAGDLNPRNPVTIKATDGTIAELTVTNASGRVVQGALSVDKTSWTLGEPLGYSSTYSVTGRADGAGGTSTPITGTYSTIEPEGVIKASLYPYDGDEVGIAMPISLSIGTDVTDPEGRANIERALTVTTDPVTEGSWAWIHHDDGWGLDWRPKEYWQAGTKVSVTANLYGVSFGDGLWGKEDISTQFTIGRAQIVQGDIDTHRLVVYRDGQVLYDFPTSFGLESDPGRVTHGGTHIVMGKEELHLMTNLKYGYKDFKAYWAVRISNNGEFIHANDDTADVQGYENVTHGCANLTMSNAKLYYDSVLPGDPVEILNSTIPLSSEDGDNYDWTIDWDDWLSRSALST